MILSLSTKRLSQLVNTDRKCSSS